MQIGTMSILFREQPGTAEHISYTESVRRCARAGFTAVDLNLCLLAAHKTTLHRDNWREETEKIRQAAADAGVALVQCHLPFKSNRVKWGTPEELAYYNQMFVRAMDVAIALGIPWAVVHPERTFSHPEWTRRQHLEENHRQFDALVDYALARGLCLAFENMYRGYSADAEDLAELIDSFGDPRVGACWDTGHANIHYKGDQWEALHIIGSRLHCTHIADNNQESDLHLVPWEGLVQWDRVMAALRDIRYDGPLILESKINFFSCSALKDENARHAYMVMKALEEL